MKVVDNTNAYFGIKLPLVADKDGKPINGTATYTMNGTDTPLVIYRLVAGTPLLRMDLIDSKLNVATNQRRAPPVVDSAVMGSRQHSHVLPYSSMSKRSMFDWLMPLKGKSSGGSFSGIKTVGTIYQEDYITRNSNAATPADGGYSTQVVTQFANGTVIPDGSYKVLFRALKITGNPKKEEDYEVWTSPEIVVKRA
jgi:hypothetical protein